jgi:hypothetical protein
LSDPITQSINQLTATMMVKIIALLALPMAAAKMRGAVSDPSPEEMFPARQLMGEMGGSGGCPSTGVSQQNRDLRTRLFIAVGLFYYNTHIPFFLLANPTGRSRDPL